MTVKIIIDEMSEEQMRKAGAYLKRVNNEALGYYIYINADVQVSIDKKTAKLSKPWYKDITFEVDYFVGGDFLRKREETRKAAKGLTSLLTELLEERFLEQE